MLTKGPTHEPRAFWLGLAILVVGIAIGLALDPADWRASGGSGDGTGGSSDELHPLFRPASGGAEEPANELVSLGLEIPPDSARVIQEVRDRAMNRGVIVQTPADTVPAFVLYDGRRMPAEIRIKGDWIDHVASDRWSLRIRLDRDRLFGMRVFSIQAPSTRGWLWEWLVLEMARRESVLAPRTDFVNVAINGNPAGIYFLEEHFSKELLESQGRREGPIVLWDESTLWSALLQAHAMPTKGVGLPIPPTAAPSDGDGVQGVGVASVRAYGEKRLSSIDSLAGTLYAAVEEMRALQRLAISASSAEGRLRRLQALAEMQGESVDTIVDTDRLACAHALASLLQLRHPLVWHNMRFYHDPLTGRLEPIMFDNMAHEPGTRDPVMFRASRILSEFAASDAYYNGVFEYLGRFTQASYLEELFEELAPELDRFERALANELPDDYRVGAMKQRLRQQQAYLRQVAFPRDPVNFHNTYELDVDPRSSGPLSGRVHVDAWATTRAPVVIEGFRFSNGSRTSAQASLVDPGLGASTTADGGVVLPRDGRGLRFTFPLDERLANLENVQQIKQAIRARATAGAGSLDLDIAALFRPIAADPAGQPSEEILRFRRQPADRGAGRPAAPTLQEALELHPFLQYRPASADLFVRPGDHTVAGDLVLPAGMTLTAEGPLTLRFAEDAVLVTDAALHLRGTADAPIVLRPNDGAKSWKGIAVLKARERSVWQHVTVENTDAVSRGGWVMTGGITFYRSPISMADCRISGALAEDGANVFGTDLSLVRVTFSGCASDSFDGDFVSGRIEACVFEDGRADGVDFSGSQAVVAGCTFRRLGDKAVSVGEDSDVRVIGGVAEDVSIGVAAKDGSEVFVRALKIKNARNYALAAYVKKEEFGPCNLIATDVTIEGAGRGDAIVQTGCRLEIDGSAVPTRELNVEKLYQDGILGR